MQDFDVDGYRVEAGTVVMVGIYAMHRDPALWDHPLVFDPDRFSPANSKDRDRWQFLPFGGGPRSLHRRSLRHARSDSRSGDHHPARRNPIARRRLSPRRAVHYGRRRPDPGPRSPADLTDVRRLRRPVRALDALRREVVIAQDSGNRDNESYLALNLAWLEAEHGDTASAFDHLTLSIRNYHDSRNTALIRAPLAILAALFPARTLRRRATIAEFAAQLTSPLHGGQASRHGLSRASGFSGHRCTKTGQQCAGRRTGLQSVDSHERTESTSKLNTRFDSRHRLPLFMQARALLSSCCRVSPVVARAHVACAIA